MLQHVPVAWENAHPVIDTNDVEGLPDRLFRTYFGGQTAYAALLACDKLGLNPNQLLLRSRRCFLKAAQEGYINLSIEGRRPGLDEDSQATIRYIIHERKRQMLFVQLFSVRRALVETGTVGPLWQQRQRLVTGREAPPLNPPPLPAPLPPSALLLNSSPNNKKNNNNTSLTSSTPHHSSELPVSLGRKNLLNNTKKNNNASRPGSRKQSLMTTANDEAEFNNNEDGSNNTSTTLIDDVGWEDQLMMLGRTGSISGAPTPMHPKSQATSRKQSTATNNINNNINSSFGSTSGTTNDQQPGLIDVVPHPENNSNSSPPPLQKKKKIEHASVLTSSKRIVGKPPYNI